MYFKYLSFRRQSINIILVHNAYTEFGGEDKVVQDLYDLLTAKGHHVSLYIKDSKAIKNMQFGKIRAFFSGIYSRASKQELRRYIEEFKPDVVHVHNVFPLISPSILIECKRLGVPVVMTVHNYRLICPNGLFMTDGHICEKCSGGREYWCILKNCENNLLKSFGYALRNYITRKRSYFLNNVNIYICLTQFQKDILIREGFHADNISILSNVIRSSKIETSESSGKYIGYVGRISREKGISTLFKAAGMCKDISFKAAGSYENAIELTKSAPSNFELCGFLDGNKIHEFYQNSRFIVLCSECYEVCPLVLLEAMNRGKAVICSRIGGLPEIVEDGITGLLFEPGNVNDLSEKIRYLWDRPDLCKKMGEVGREKALQLYSPEKYYESLMTVYKKAIQMTPKPVI